MKTWMSIAWTNAEHTVHGSKRLSMATQATLVQASTRAGAVETWLGSACARVEGVAYRMGFIAFENLLGLAHLLKETAVLGAYQVLCLEKDGRSGIIALCFRVCLTLRNRDNVGNCHSVSCSHLPKEKRRPNLMQSLILLSINKLLLYRYG